MTGPFTACATDDSHGLHDGPDINLRALPAAAVYVVPHKVAAEIDRPTYHVAGPCHESHQAYWFAVLTDHVDAELLMRLHGVEAFSDVPKGHTDVWVTTARTHMTRVHRKARRTRTVTVPTSAGCQRVGHGEHLATEAHPACRRGTVPDAAAGREQVDV